MGATSIWHWIIVLLIVVLLFGRSKISDIMGDVANGIKSFQKGMSEDEGTAQSSDKPKVIEQSAVKPVDRVETESSKAS